MAGKDKHYDMTAYPVQVAVRSESDGAEAYMVHLPYCPCPDFTNRKGRLDVIDGVPVISICKHVAEAMQRVGGWHREAEKPRPVLYPVITRQQAVTVLTSHYISSGLTNRLLLAACAADGMWVVEDITTGQLAASYDKGSRRYSVRVPAGQPLNVPASASAFPAAPRA
jgi:hypothetical protein